MKNQRYSFTFASLFLVPLFFLVQIGDVKPADAQESWASAKKAWSKTKNSDEAKRSYYGPRQLGAPITPFSPSSNNLSVAVGQIFLMGDLSENYSDNIGWQIRYTYGVSEIFGFNAGVGYSSHSDGDFGVGNLNAGMRVNLSWYDRVVPHLNFGLGFYRPEYQVSPSTSLSAVLFGVHAGPGVDLELNDQFFFGTNLTVHNIFATQKTAGNGVTKEIGGTYSSFLVHAGMTL